MTINDQSLQFYMSDLYDMV